MKRKDIIISVVIAILLSIVMIFFNFSKKENVIIDKSNEKNITYKETQDNIKKDDETQVIKSDNNKSEVVVYISGQVKNPQVVTMKNGDRLVDAIEKCGGMSKDADTNAVNLALLLKDEAHYIVPKIGESTNIQNNTTKSSTTQNSLININTADKNTLMNLPSVGEKTAEKIINYRDTNGKFNSINDLKNVSGIGEKKFEQIKDFITVQ